jgi:nucleotide-binding universal stress UspA family protein
MVISNERIPLERVLCPIDLASDSSGALRYGIGLARKYEAKLFVCYCVEPGGIKNGSSRRLLNQALDDSVKQHMRVSPSVGLDWESVVLDGDPVAAIAGFASHKAVDLMLMRSRRRPIAAPLMGSVAESLCRTAPCPVMVTHAPEHEWAGLSTNELDLEMIAVAYDFSTDSELALSYGLSLAQEFQAKLHLVHVLPPHSGRRFVESSTPSLEPKDGFAAAAARLHNCIPEGAPLWCEVTEVLLEGYPYRELLAYAEDSKIDLICLGANGSGFGLRSLFGSNADRVLRQARCPVLVARPLRPDSIAAGEPRPSHTEAS